MAEDNGNKERQVEIERRMASQKQKNDLILEIIRPFINDATFYIAHQLQIPGILNGSIHISAEVEGGIIIKGHLHSDFERPYMLKKDGGDVKKDPAV